MKIIKFSILMLLISSAMQVLINKQDNFLSGQSDDNEAERAEAPATKSENKSNTVKSISIAENNQNSSIKSEEKNQNIAENKQNAHSAPVSNKTQENNYAQRKPDNTSSEKAPLVDLKTVNLDFVNTIAKRITQINPSEKEGSKFNMSILIGNTNVKLENKNVRQ